MKSRLICSLGAWLFPILALAQTVLPADAARSFIATLSGDERIAMQSYTARDRLSYRLTPGQRGGLALKHMDSETRSATWALLNSLLSARGIAIVEAVIDREARLGKIEGNPRYRDPKLYYLAIFGQPGADRWGTRFEGHHLSLNITLSGDRVIALTPFMVGANPREAQPNDVLLPFVSLARESSAVRQTFIGLFNTDQGVMRLDDFKSTVVNFDGFAHPHVEITSAQDFGAAL